MDRNIRPNHGVSHLAQTAALLVLVLLLAAASSINLSCAEHGNASEAEREELLHAIRSYWFTGKDYHLGFTSGVGKINYAEIHGDEAEVRVEIVLGYRQPTEGAGYKETTFRLLRIEDSWEVVYDGWLGREVEDASVPGLEDSP